ncbi:MAG: hypothetical protein E7Z84_02340 [Methanosphaera stadtmanae]|nr:hypothetical protein [Methanosphaera stadtmanae]
MTAFYDFDIAPNEEIINTLEDFNYNGACIFYDSDEYNEKIKSSFLELNDSTNLNLYHGIRINETNPQILSKKIQKYYQKVDLIMVNGTNTKINRVACESPKIDILNHPYLNQNNSGINHVLAKLINENNITVSIDLNSILHHRGYYKSKILSQINQLLMLKRKYNFKTIITTGSTTFYDVRSPEEILLLSKLMDMNEEEAKKNISDNVTDIIENITIRKQSIVDGVRIIKN